VRIPLMLRLVQGSLDTQVGWGVDGLREIGRKD
jgi:hypothetical protein